MDNFSWLEDWYARQCNGDWEHQSGVKIDTLDNPGWRVVIDLNGTRYDDVQNRDLLDHQTDDFEWIHCIIRDGRFLGYGGPKMLGKIVQAFRKWIEQY